jgi:UPF0755 protein
VKKLLAVILLVAGGAAAFLAFQTFHPFRGYSGSVIVSIPPGSGAASAARILAAHGVLQTRAAFLAFYAIGRVRHRTLKAGEYLFDHPLSARDVYWKIERGDVYYHLVVIPEGSDRFDIARILHDRLGLDPQAFLIATAQPETIRDLDPSAPSLEGYLFPDTYRLPASTTAASAADVMVERFRQVLDARFGSILTAGSGPGLHDVLTLASLVEKETPNPGERAEIAGVFTRRLRQNMPLDCDPTVVYAARLESSPAGPPPATPAPITAGQLASNSPYNTYRRAGLPPGPICSPGAASIEAALHPADGDALYFVSNLHGGHVFSSTLAEHNRNVARYRRASAAQSDDNGAANNSPGRAGAAPARHRRTRKRVPAEN